ncbi:immunity protein YezG family protein [Bacillus sp. JCM 19041]|uniref:immunity protein YezG family protein n=1 Tax=Bacillus sp. JCM 19041 TaxID=1460637 RepID=UPI0006CFF850
MSFKDNANEIIERLAQLINETIPVTWKEVYFEGGIYGEYGGVFYFFNTFESDVFTYFYDIPNLYNLDEDVYDHYENELFDCTAELQDLFIENNQEPWASVILIMNEGRKQDVRFEYIDWSKSPFNQTDRFAYFQYKYLNKSPKNEKEKEVFLKIAEFEKMM